MKPEQSKIYYVTADTFQAATHSPHLEVFRKKGVEVLLLTDRVDEWMLSFLNEFDGKPLQSVARGDLDLGALNDEEKQAQEKVSEELKPLVEKMKEALKDKAKDVRLTFRLTDSPSCLVADDGEMSGYLQRMLKAAGQQAPSFHPILEVNPEHALVKSLHTDSANFDDWCHLLFDQAMLAEGGALEDPASFVKRTNALLLARAG
jgi:molecular chaperone HtpG